ncbi:MAG: hypothetical protein NTZ78_09510 [Candidatus Aureabacteria bacterium]|nr:hypothetical protein [Candidatus Auribacterota bacterium]
MERLGASCRVETVRIGKRGPEDGPPEGRVVEFRATDELWEDAWREGRVPKGNAWNGLQ